MQWSYKGLKIIIANVDQPRPAIRDKFLKTIENNTTFYNV
jgi:hypothetical protein